VKIDGNYIVMDNGTRFYAFSGCLGLDHDPLRITYGYDGWVGEFDLDQMRAEHKREIADFMITLWTTFREEQK